MKKATTLTLHKPLNEIGLLTINELNTHPELDTFYVSSYQRGYRWGKDEVESLLTDIDEITQNKKYCIQPLAVTKKEDKVWELIDGQQRSTTIYIILSVFKNHFSKAPNGFYKLDYNTRKATKLFLEEISNKNQVDSFVNTLDKIKSWEDLVALYPQKDNIDNYHIFNAYILIYSWLSKKESVNDFYKKLIHQTYVIWHPVIIAQNSSQTVEDFFINMNAGKIKLTSAELIKALFILEIDKSDKPWDIREFEKKKLANEWDGIENELHNNSFWFFVNNNEKQNYPSRIGKLFDIDCNRKDKDKDMYAYFQYSNPESKKKLKWQNIKQIFQRLKEWYEDVETYHLIGYLINTNFLSLAEIISETEKKKKSEIIAFLKKTIVERFKSERQKDKKKVLVYDLKILDYVESYAECKNVLLLYNIKLIENTFPNQRFPFDLYQAPNNQWSIEHIHPQNPKELKNIEEAKAWLKDFEFRIIEEKEENKEKLEGLKTALLKEKNSLSRDLSAKINEFSDLMNDSFELHKMGNQALLDKHTNSKIGNKSFLEKRGVILNSENRKDSYIPLGTINNFLKKTTLLENDEKMQMNYWSSKDAEDYTNDIKQLLKEYLPNTEDYYV